MLTLLGRVFAPRSRKGILKRRVSPSNSTLTVIKVSGVTWLFEAMMLECQS